jgi:hypothetical protein
VDVAPHFESFVAHGGSLSMCGRSEDPPLSTVNK